VCALFALCAQHHAPDDLSGGVVDQGLQHVPSRRPERHIDGEALRCYCLRCPGNGDLFGGAVSRSTGYKGTETYKYAQSCVYHWCWPRLGRLPVSIAF
jgi:hypothetical protein